METLQEMTFRVMDENEKRGMLPFHPNYCGPCFTCAETLAQGIVFLSDEGVDNGGGDVNGTRRYKPRESDRMFTHTETMRVDASFLKVRLSDETPEQIKERKRHIESFMASPAACEICGGKVIYRWLDRGFCSTHRDNCSRFQVTFPTLKHLRAAGLQREVKA